MTEARSIDDQDNEFVEADQMDSTMLKAHICSSPGCASVQHSEGDSIRMDMNELSVQSDEDKIEQESVDEMEQQISDDEGKNSPLARRTRSARASKHSRFVLSSAIVPDESDDVFVDRCHNMIPKGKPTNKYFSQALRKLRLRKQMQSPARG